MKLLIVENPRPLTFEHYNDVANAPLSASLNSGYALAVARLADWEASYLDFTTSMESPESLAETILAEAADMILFHWVYSWGHEQLVRDLLTLLKSNSNAPLGAFGLFPTISHARLMQYAPALDFILAGEFEETLSELLASFIPGQAMALPGMVLRHQEFVARPLISELSQLPVPDDVGGNLAYASLNISASRGCYGNCSFCFIQPFYGCSRRRVRSPASLELELRERLARRSVESLYFIDPTFLAPGAVERERVLAISSIARDTGLPFGFETRVDTVDKALLSTLARNGASSVFLGIESGCDSVLQRIGKRITRDQIIRAVQTVQECGLQLAIGFIMFEPDTNLAELEENYHFLDGLGLLANHELTANLLYHNQILLHGSPAWQSFEQQGRLIEDQRLPFEARYRFRDERVGLVCAAMGRLSSEYFCGLARLRNRSDANCSASAVEIAPGCNLQTDALNDLLKNAFRSLCASADLRELQHVKKLEESCREQLRKLLHA